MPKEILIVDDEVDVVKVLMLRLQARGYDVRTVGTGKEGIAVTVTERPDLVILDYRLPDMPATEVARGLREAGSKVPIIMITARIEDIDTKAAACDAVECLAKPIEPEALYQAVEAALGG